METKKRIESNFFVYAFYKLTVNVETYHTKQRKVKTTI